MKTYIDGPGGIRVPQREITLTNGDCVRLYDTSGRGSDPTVGLPSLRNEWILGRDDVEEVMGRATTLRDDGRAPPAGAAPPAARRGPARHDSHGAPSQDAASRSFTTRGAAT